MKNYGTTRPLATCTKKLNISAIGLLHMALDQGKDGSSGSRDTGKEISVYKKNTGKDERNPLKKFNDRFMKPQDDGHYSIVHDVLVAIIVVLIIITCIYGYTRTWPPVVVVESGSMQHDTDTSALGVIDTGDIVMVKKVNSPDDIRPWSIGKEENYETYGEYGDVIIYDKNGKGGTPVIHRAIVFIQVNDTDKQPGDPFTFDVPEWGIFNNRTIEYYIEELNLQIKYTPPRGHDGYLTKGDNRVTNRNDGNCLCQEGDPLVRLTSPGIHRSCHRMARGRGVHDW
jgi:signal peptidase I